MYTVIKVINSYWIQLSRFSFIKGGNNFVFSTNFFKCSFFAVIFFGLWIPRSGADDLGESSAIWIYPITAALAFVMVVMDGTVTRFFAKVDVEKSTLDSKKYQLRYLKWELQKLHEDLAKRVISRDEY